MTKLSIAEQTEVSKAKASFKQFDARGREKGRMAVMYSAVVVDAGRSWWTQLTDIGMNAGEKVYIVECHATRDGIRFGASQRYHFFSTMEEAQEYIDK